MTTSQDIDSSGALDLTFALPALGFQGTERQILSMRSALAANRCAPVLVKVRQRLMTADPRSPTLRVDNGEIRETER